MNLPNHASTFKFNTTDELIPTKNDIADTGFISLPLNKDDVFVEHSVGNGSVVNRSSGDALYLETRFWDVDRNYSYPNNYIINIQGRFYYTKNGQTFVESTPVFSNGSGYVYISIPIDCSFTVGPQWWKAGNVGETAWKNTNSTNFTYIVVTEHLSANITYPDGQPFRRGIDDIVLKGYVWDDCGPVEGATVVFKIPSENYECVNVYEEGSGYYNCTIPASATASWATGWHDVTIEVIKEYYNGTNVTKVNSFYVATEPEVKLSPEYPTAEASGDGGWGEEWTFSAWVQDLDGDIINVSLWLNLTGEFEMVNSTTLVAVSPTKISFEGHTFDCEHIGTRNFRFYVYDVWNYDDEYQNTFTIDKDDIMVEYIAGAGTQVNRTGNDVELLRLRIKDTDRNVYVGENVSGAFFVTTEAGNLATYMLAGTNETDDQSMLSYYFNPNCSYRVGVQNWKGGTYGDECYKDTIPDYGFTIEITGQLVNNLEQPEYGDIIPVGDVVLIRLNVSSDCSYEEGEIPDTDVTIRLGSPNNEWEYCTPVYNETGAYAGWYNCSWNTSFHVGGWWDIRINSAKSYYYDNITTYEDWIYLNNTPPLYENLTVTPSTGGWGEVFTYSVDIEDSQYDNVTCKLLVTTDGGTTWELKNSTTIYWGRGTCSLSVSDFDCSDIGTDNYFMFELDDGTNLFNTTNVTGPNIERDDVEIEYVQGNESFVNRSFDQTTLLVLRIKDTDKQTYVGSGVNGSIWVTYDGTNYFTIPTSNTTNATSYLNIYFNPTCDYEVGKQYWTGGVHLDSCYKDTNITENLMLTVIGDLSTSVSAILKAGVPSYYFLKGENVTIMSNVTNDCLLGVGGASVNITLIHETGVEFVCTPVDDLGGGDYRCIQNTSTILAREYNISVFGNKTYYNDGYSVYQHAFFVETKPFLEQPNVTASGGAWDFENDWAVGGWGETWYFRVNITDEDLDNVTIRLYVREFGSSTWVFANSTEVYGPINQTVVIIYSNPGEFQSNQGVWEYYFVAEDTRGYTDETQPLNFTVEKDDVILELVEGDGASVWRNGTYPQNGSYVWLKLRIVDTDRNAPADNAQAMFWVTYNGTQYDEGITTSSDLNGIIQYPFDPDCRYSVEPYNQPHYWKGGVVNDPYWKNTNSSEYTVIINTFLGLNVTWPDGIAYLVGTPILIRGYAYDDCGYVENASIGFKARIGYSEYTCTPVLQEGQGYYNCTWDSTAKPYGWYTVKMTGSKSYHPYNETIKSNSFFLASNPQINNPSVDHTLGGWGELYTFIVYITDRDKNNNNVSLWKSFDNVTWTLVDSKIVKPYYTDTQVKFEERFTCEDFLNATNGLNYFKFTVVDEYGFSNETKVLNFTLEEDDASVQISSESSQNVRRIGNSMAYLKFVIYDTDHDVYPSNVNGTVWITENHEDYTVSLTCLSNGGNCSVLYDPSCSSLVGVQKWKAGTTDACYKQVNSSEVTLTVIGQLNVSLIEPTNGKILNRDRNETLIANVSTDCLSYYENATVSWYNSTNHLLAQGYETTWHVPATHDLGPETINVIATGQYYDQNSNSTNVFIYGWSEIEYISPPNGTVVMAGITQTVECRVIDPNMSIGIENYTINFYKNGILQESLLSDNEGKAQWSWVTSNENPGYYNISCNISDDTTLYYNASIRGRSTIIRVKRPLIIDQINLQYGSIYRNDTFAPHETNITVHVNDANIGDAENATVYFYNETHDFIDNCTTNATGYCWITYNAPEGLDPGTYLIFINATKEGLEDSETVNITIGILGKLYITIVSPQNGTYHALGTVLTLSADIIDEKGDSVSATVRWYTEKGLIATGADTTWYITGIETGPENITCNATRSYYDKGEDSVIIIITGLADVVWVAPQDGSILPYPESFDVVCRVEDHNTGTAVEDYVVEIWHNFGAGYVFDGSFLTNSTGHVNMTWTPTDKGDITFKCNITDNTTLEYTTNIKEATALLHIRDLEPPQIFNTSIMPNTSIEANLNYTTIKADVIDNYGIASVWAAIGLPNGTEFNLTMTYDGNNTYSVDFTPSIDGIHNVTVYAMDMQPESNINYTFVGYFYVWGKAYGAPINIPDQITAYGITQNNGFTFDLLVNFTNIGPGTAYGANLTVYNEPSGYIIYNVTSKSCGTVHVNTSCIWAVKVTVLPATPPMLISVYSNATWRNPDLTLNMSYGRTDVIVAENPVINIIEEVVEKETPHDKTTYVGNVTVESVGNAPVEDILISLVGGNLAIDCPECVITMFPTEQGILDPGENFTIDITATVPAGQAPGIYWTKIRASSSNAGYDESLLNLTVPRNSSWLRWPETFGTLLAALNTSGTVGEINISNVGNVKISFTLYKTQDAAPFVTVTPSAFDLEKQVSRVVNITFSIPEDTTPGEYYGEISIRGTETDTGDSATPYEMATNFTLNITDVPPFIMNVSVVPTKFEIIFEMVNISAVITDNFEVSTAWINVTIPNNVTITRFMVKNGSTYLTTYNSSLAGIHKLKICANDTANLINCTDIIELVGVGNTTVSIIPNATLVYVNNVTLDQGSNFGLNFTVIDSGYARVYNASVNITTSSSMTPIQDYFFVGDMLRNESWSNETTILVSAGTPPGTYFVNITASWTNLDNSTGFNYTTVNINVTSTPVIDIIQDSVALYIPDGSTGSTNITLNSTGNDAVRNIVMSCMSGVVCENFTVSFSPRTIASIDSGQTLNVTVSITVPDSFPNGNYTGVIKATGIDTSDTMEIQVIVPINLSWTQSPSSIEKEVIQGTQGKLGDILIHNSGNAKLVLDIIKAGNVSGYVDVGTDRVTVDVDETKTLSVTYIAPRVTEMTTLTGYIATYNYTDASGPQEKRTYITIGVHPYYVDIVEPTEEKPLINVTPGDMVFTKVNVTYGVNPLSSNVSFEVRLSDTEIENFTASYNSTDKLWYINFTAPSLPLARGYDLNVTANYTIKGLVLSDTEAKAIVYLDMEPPLVAISVPPKIDINSTVRIEVNATDAGGVSGVNATIKYPDNSTEDFVLNFVMRDGDTYVYELYFSNTSKMGVHIINATACDVSGNCNSSTKSFEIYPMVWFAGIAVDEEQMSKPPIHVEFRFLDPATESLLFFIQTDSTGYYNDTIDARTYNLNISVFNESLVLYGTDILTDVYNPIVFGIIPVTKVGRGALRAIAIDSILNSSHVMLAIDYSPFKDNSDVTSSHLAIYYCSQWERYKRCASTWTRLTSTVDTIGYKVYANTTSLSGAFALAQYICGNGICESDYGESTAVCPQDCAPPPTITVPPGVGPGGPGAARVRVPTVPTVPVEELRLPPYEIKSTLLYVTLQPGEYETHSMDITNNLAEDVDVSLTVEGVVSSFLTLDKMSFTISGKTTEVVKVKVYVPESAAPGVYTGDIVTKIGEEEHRTPVTVKVVLPPEPLLDVIVKALTKTVRPGENLQFEVRVVNMGPTPSIEDIKMTYMVKNIKTEEIIATTTETIAVTNVLSYKKTILIPETAPPTRYVIEVNASYWYGRKYAYAADSFEVSALPAPLLILKAVFMHWLTYVILFMLTPAVYLGLRFYNMYRLKKMMAARYIFPVDFKKLPQKSPRSIPVGKIAETDIKAYLEIDKLTMHSIAAGGTGSGKSVSAMVVAEELLKRNIPVIVFDPTAQWTGFMKPCQDKHMLDLYDKFGLKKEDARGFKTNIIVVKDVNMPIDIRKYMEPGEITVFVMNRLKPAELDKFVRRTIDSIFAIPWPESKELKLLIVYDEVHRLLPKYGGKGGYVALERGCREFRKWGIGLFMISQVLMDFRGAIRANIATEIQLRTKYEGDINRVKTKYGPDYASKITKLTIGTGLVQNPEYNDGKPWFVTFRPLLHNTFRLTDEELDMYDKLNTRVAAIEKRIEELKARKVDTYDVELELKIAKEKMKQGAFKMASTYLDSVEARLKGLG